MTKINEFLSVIIPTYNRKGFLKEALISVLNQKNVNLEIIVVDDGSTDGTREEIKNFPIRYFYKERGGPASARNLGIKKAKGNFIAFLDSDDLWLEEKAYLQLKFFQENPEYLIVHSNEIWIKRGKVLKQKERHKKGGGDQFERALELCIISPSAVMMKRELFDLVGLFDESFPACEDYEFWLRVTSRFKIGFLEKELVVKRGGHKDQLSSTIPCLDYFRAKAIGKLLKENWFTKEQEKIAKIYLEKKAKIYLNGLKKRGKNKEAKEFEEWLTNI